ncbi:hypothetical protein K2173_006923 [Erythroxylum novogranatense]|uniref:Protein TSSC4 n=1 Tax=Erythroxylum novogranatense TaxID=1862640 RepID=A0AAV8SYL3_9ROSI|nr:hypothetical protein K2173_006923 [Erythroxylum novogranatense]
MASPSPETAADGSFRLRVEKVFGSLTSSSPQPSSLQSTLWSISDDEVQRKQWKRDTTSSASDREHMPCASSFDELAKDRRRSFRREMKHDRDELDDRDDDDDEESGSERRRVEAALDEWEIRSSIGLDSTLDNEEEEDEYDKVATGKENAGERLYMKDVVSDQGSCLGIHDLPRGLLHCNKDPRANHLAARARLQEDEAEGEELKSNFDCHTEVNQPNVKAGNEYGGPLRSILKRKNSSLDVGAKKRVRFDPSCKTVCEEVTPQNVQEDSSGGAATMDAAVSADESVSGWCGVPGYLRNPSKYTRYSFDSYSDLDDKSNTQAFMDFLKLVKHREAGSEFVASAAGLPKSVTFIPKRKVGEVTSVENSRAVRKEKDDVNQPQQHGGMPIGIAANESQDSEVDKVEADESEPTVVAKVVSSEKPSRQYRRKSSADDLDV